MINLKLITKVHLLENMMIINKTTTQELKIKNKTNYKIKINKINQIYKYKRRIISRHHLQKIKLMNKTIISKLKHKKTPKKKISIILIMAKKVKW